MVDNCSQRLNPHSLPRMCLWHGCFAACVGAVQERAELERSLLEERANNSSEKQRLQSAAAAAEHLAHNHAAQVNQGQSFCLSPHCLTGNDARHAFGLPPTWALSV